MGDSIRWTLVVLTVLILGSFGIYQESSALHVKFVERIQGTNTDQLSFFGFNFGANQGPTQQTVDVDKPV